MICPFQCARAAQFRETFLFAPASLLYKRQYVLLEHVHSKLEIGICMCLPINTRAPNLSHQHVPEYIEYNVICTYIYYSLVCSLYSRDRTGAILLNGIEALGLLAGTRHQCCCCNGLHVTTIYNMSMRLSFFLLILFVCKCVP